MNWLFSCRLLLLVHCTCTCIDLNHNDLSFDNLLNWRDDAVEPHLLCLHEKIRKRHSHCCMFSLCCYYVSFLFESHIKIFCINLDATMQVNQFVIIVRLKRITFTIERDLEFKFQEEEVWAKNELGICVECNLCCCTFCYISACNRAAWFIWRWRWFIKMWSINYNRQRNICNP